MKTSKLIMITASAALAFGAMNGCGGGNSSKVALVELTPATAESLAQNAADALPGCTYVSESVLASSKSLNIIDVSTVQKVIEDTKELTPLFAVLPSNTVNGTCPTDPGSYTISGTHEDGIDDLTYTFVNYCLGDDTDNTTIHGVAYVTNVGIPSDTGPIPQYSTLSTESDGIEITDKNTEGEYTGVVKATDIKYVYGNGDDNATAENPDILTASSLSAFDGNETTSMSNVDISTYISGTDTVLTINNLTYTDPEVGTVNISSTAIVMNDTGVITEGEITVTGANDTSLTMPLYPSVTNAFSVVIGEDTIGVLDCSGLNSDILL